MLILTEAEDELVVSGPPIAWVPEVYRVRWQREKLSYALKYHYRIGIDLVRLCNDQPLPESLWFVRAHFGSLDQHGFNTWYVADTTPFRFSQIPDGENVAEMWCELDRRGKYGRPLSSALLEYLQDVRVHCDFNPAFSRQPIFEVSLGFGKIEVAGFLPETFNITEHCYVRTMVDD